jgi:cytochrome P450
MAQPASALLLDPATGLVVVFAVLCFVVLYRWRSNPLPYPPGPHRDPFFGNIRQMMNKNQEQEFARWGKIYGDVNFAKVFSQPFVILNSFRAAKDLLEKRGSIYSSRPRMVLVVELMGWGDPLVHQDTGLRMRKHRRVVQEHFSARSLAKFTSLQRKEVYTTLFHMGNTPDDFEHHFKRFCKFAPQSLFPS